MKAQEKSNIPFLLAGVIAGAMLLRLGLVLALPRVIWRDEVDYLLLGHNLLSGQGFTNLDGSAHLHFPPGYPFVVGTLARLVGDLEWASNLVYVLCGGALLVSVFVLARRLYGTPTAWLGVLLVTTCPMLSVSVLYWGSMTEPLYMCLIYGGLAALLVGLEDQRWGWLPTAGLLFGLAYLVRPEACGYVAMSLLVILAWSMRRGIGRLRQMCWAIGGCVVAFALVAAPYVWYLHTHTGQWLLSGKGGVTWETDEALSRGDWATVDEIVGRLWEKPESFQFSLVQKLLADPRGFARRVLRNVRQLLYEARVYLVGFLPWVTLALFRTPWDRRRVAHEAFLVAALLPFSVILAFHIEARYFAPALPVLLLWVAQGAHELGAWLAQTLALWRGRPLAGRRLTALVQWGPAGVLVLVLMSLLPPTARAAQASVPLHYKTEGLWLRAHTPAGTKVMTLQDAITLYADRIQVPLPRTAWPGVLETARAQQADYLVVGEAELRRFRPQLASLLASPPPELAFVHSFEDGGRRTWVYRFVGSP
jgi:4-amino-4-deoxy-L-arabinose transferase-like glycosyltransferase